MDTKELEATITGLQKELSEMKAQKPAVVTVEVPKELAALPGVIKELAESNAALQKRIDALEKDGTPQTSQRDLGEVPEPMNARISVDRRTGTIRRV